MADPDTVTNTIMKFEDPFKAISHSADIVSASVKKHNKLKKIVKEINYS